MKKKFLMILLCGVLLMGITGCGSNESKGDSRFNYIIDELNTASEESLRKSDGVSVVTLEERFLQNLASTKIIACGDKPFTKNVDLTQTSYTMDLEGYDGEIAYVSTRMAEETKINYCLVIATDARGYLNVTVNYEKNDDGNIKPIFSIPELLN